PITQARLPSSMDQALGGRFRSGKAHRGARNLGKPMVACAISCGEALMRTTLLAAGATLAMLSATTSAQAPAPAAPPATCYTELRRLLAAAPPGIGALGAAIRELPQQLRPQVEASKVLKPRIARLERQAESAARPGIQQASLDFGDTALAPPVRDDAAAEE